MKSNSYFDSGVGGDEKKPSQPIAPSDNDGDEQKADAPVATITIHKKPEGGHMAKVDEGDGMPPDEHDSIAEMAKALEEKYGENATEDAEEKVAPGVHEKAGNYLSKMVGGK